MNSIIAVLAALAQQTRLEVLTLLGRGPVEGLTSGDLAVLASVPANSMSTHLSILAAAGLVSATRKGRKVTYRIEKQAIEGALDNLSTRLGDKAPKAYTGIASWMGVTPVAEPGSRSRTALRLGSPGRCLCTADFRLATGPVPGRNNRKTSPGQASRSTRRSGQNARPIARSVASR